MKKKHLKHSPLRQWWCAIKALGRHDYDCNYSSTCDGNHRCRACGAV